MEDISPILDLHCDAFADKFGGAFGVRGIARGVAAMEAAWRQQGSMFLRGMLVAEWEGQVIGTTMLRTWEMERYQSGSTEMAFQQTLGLWGATWSIFALSLLSHHIEQYEGFITDVAVHKLFRRRGIARALLRSAEEQAHQYRKTYLSLYVSRSNLGARTLYDYLGFQQQFVRRSWLTRLIFGQREWVYMRKNLT